MNAQAKIAAQPTEKLLVLPGPSKPAIRLLVPREHGTWGLLLFPLISGAIVGYQATSNVSLAAVLWFFLTALSAFLIYQPLESLLGLSLIKARSQRQQRIAIFSVLTLAVIATAGVLELFHLHRGLILAFGVVALGCFGIRIVLGSSRSMRVPRQLIGALGSVRQRQELITPPAAGLAGQEFSCGLRHGFLRLVRSNTYICVFAQHRSNHG